MFHLDVRFINHVQAGNLYIYFSFDKRHILNDSIARVKSVGHVTVIKASHASCNEIHAYHIAWTHGFPYVVDEDCHGIWRLHSKRNLEESPRDLDVCSSKKSRHSSSDISSLQDYNVKLQKYEEFELKEKEDYDNLSSSYSCSRRSIQSVRGGRR